MNSILERYLQSYIFLAQKDFFLFLLITLTIVMFINFFIIDPIAFKFFIIPKIEKRLGEKLQYKNPIYKWQIFSSWFMPPVDIAPTIVFHCLTWKIKKNHLEKFLDLIRKVIAP